MVMAISRKVQQGQITKQAILEAGEHLFYEKGVAATTLDDIAEKAGVTRGAIYWHFKNRNEVLEAVVDNAVVPIRDLFRQMMDAMETPSIEALKSTCVAVLKSIASSPQKQRGLTILVLKCEYTEETKHIFGNDLRYQEEAIVDFISLLDRISAVDPDVVLFKSSKMIAESLTFYCIGLVTQLLKYPDKIDLMKDCDDYIDIFFNGIMMPKNDTSKEKDLA